MLMRCVADDDDLVCRLNDLGHARDGVLVALAVPPDGTQCCSFLLVTCGDDGVHDHDGLEHGVGFPLLDVGGATSWYAISTRGYSGRQSASASQGASRAALRP